MFMAIITYWEGTVSKLENAGRSLFQIPNIDHKIVPAIDFPPFAVCPHFGYHGLKYI